MTGSTVNITGSTINNQGTINLTGSGISITNGTGFITDSDVTLNSSVNFITGISQSGVVYNINTGATNIEAISGGSFHVTGGNVNFSGEAFTISGDVNVTSGTFSNVQTIQQDLNLNNGSQGTFVNPTINDDVISYGTLQINGDVTLDQVTGDTLIHGVLRYEYTGSIPTSSSDTYGETGQVAYDSNYLYIKVSGAGWRRTALGSW